MGREPPSPQRCVALTSVDIYPSANSLSAWTTYSGSNASAALSGSYARKLWYIRSEAPLRGQQVEVKRRFVCGFRRIT